MTSKSLIYTERPPRSALASWVQCLWTFDATHLHESTYDHFVPPDGCISIVQKGRAPTSHEPPILVGPRWQPYCVTIDAGVCYEGIRLWPFAAKAFLGDRLPSAIGRIGVLSEFDSPLAEAIRTEVQPENGSVPRSWHASIQSLLELRMQGAAVIDENVRTATEFIVRQHGRSPISELARNFPVGLRQLQRRFSEETGLSLKQFARIRRFRKAAAELLEDEPRAWCHVAIENGFADQAHLTREFSQLIGLSPQALRSKHAAILHELVQP